MLTGRRLSGRRMILGGAVGLVAVLLWFFPLFHIRPLSGEATQGSTDSSSGPDDSNSSNAGDGIESLASKAKPITQFFEAFDRNADQAKKMFGQQAGLGGAFFFCLSGAGQVESMDKDRVTVLVEGSNRRVCLELGTITDNTVRESVGIKASQFTNSQAFNARSAELNQQVEQFVIAANRGLFKEGGRVEFVGCGKVNSSSQLDLLSLIPIQLKHSP